MLECKLVVEVAIGFGWSCGVTSGETRGDRLMAGRRHAVRRAFLAGTMGLKVGRWGRILINVGLF